MDKKGYCIFIDVVRLIAVVMLLSVSTGIVSADSHDLPRECTVNQDELASEDGVPSPCSNFDFSPEKPTTQDAVEFDASPSFQPVGGEIDRYAWDIYESGGAEVVDQTTTEVFGEPGSYNVTLTVVNRAGKRTSYTKEITVVRAPPVAEFSYSPDPPVRGEPIEFNASESVGRESSIVSYDWGAGEGTIGSGETITHTYDRYGEYDVSLTVSDGKVQNTTTRTIAVNNLPPVPKITFERLPDSLTVDNKIAVDSSGTYDPDGGGIEGYTWEFGDGTVIEDTTAEHSYTSPGTYSLSLTADDGRESNTRTIQLEVINRPPKASFSRSPTDDGVVGESIEFDASESHDPDKNIEEFIWEFGDGETESGEIVEHTYDELGDYEVALTVSDGSETDTATENLTVEPGEQSADGFGVPAALISILSLRLFVRYRREGGS